MNKEQEKMNNDVFQNIIDYLILNNIVFSLLDHEPIYTMEQAVEVCSNLPEQGVKVIFARTYFTKTKYDYCLIVWTGNKPINFDQVAKILVAKKVKLATTEEVKQNLNIEIGALSPFGYRCNYPVILDSLLLEQQEVYINPGVHNKTIKMSTKDLKKSIEQNSKKLFLT